MHTPSRGRPPARAPFYSRHTPVVRLVPNADAAHRWQRDAVGFAAECRASFDLPHGALWSPSACVVREARTPGADPYWQVYLGIQCASVDEVYAPLRDALHEATADPERLGALCAHTEALMSPNLDATVPSARHIAMLSSEAIDAIERDLRHAQTIGQMRETRAAASEERRQESAVLDGTIYSLREQLGLDGAPARLFRDDGAPRPSSPPMTTGSPTAPRALAAASAPVDASRAATGARRWTADDIASLVLLYGGGNARAHQQLQVVAQVIRDNCLDGEMLSTEYDSLESVMAMLREECAASGGQLDGPRFTRVAKLLRELLVDPDKERQHRADVQRLSREQRDALYTPKFERAPPAAAASPPWSGGQEVQLQSEMLRELPSADPRATAELEALRQVQAVQAALEKQAVANMRVEAETKARIEAEARARVEAEARARIVEVEAKAQIEQTNLKAQVEAEEARARVEAEANKARIVEVEAKARVEAASKAQVEAEHKARFAEQEMKAKLEQQELRARLEQELKIKELELKAKAEVSSESVTASPQRDMHAVFEQIAREAETRREVRPLGMCAKMRL